MASARDRSHFAVEGALRVQRVIPRRRFSGLETRALRRAGSMKGFGVFNGAAVPADWQVDPQALLALAAAAQGKPKGRLGRLAYFRGFGLSPTADAAAAAVGSRAAAAGAGAAASALGAGAAAGPIGLAAGAVVALALTLFQKQYFNVADANAACATQEQVWQKYASVQGHVAGRALGWNTMIVVWHGAVGEGLFPLNSQHLSFHEGTLNCAGTGAWSDSFLGETLQGTPGSCSQDNCLPNALQKFNPSAVPQGTPAAVYFIDNIVLPMNASDQIPWINNAATNPVVHQLLYDVADAYLAQHNLAPTPYVKYPAGGTTPATSGSSNSAPAQPAPAQPAFPGFDSSIVASDPRLSQSWTVNDDGPTILFTPASPAGFYSASYPGEISADIQIAISGNAIKILRQDNNGGWASYTGTFDSTGLRASGTSMSYGPAQPPTGTKTSWSATIAARPAPSGAALTGATAPVAASQMTVTPTMSEGATMPVASPVNVTVSAPAALTPQSSNNTLLWVAIAGLGAVVILGMQHGKKH